MIDDIAVPLTFTDAAANKVKSLISEEENTDLKLRVYITGGGAAVSNMVLPLMKKSMTAI
ncbi:hypothetical protein HIY_11830 [Haemophilus influenzae]|nr:essential respiratory protein A [Haemophilus influenzae]PRK96934.1 Iron-sulfur cluster insertion protein ErpA [Haemophilus influenzae]BCB66638.1 hypothetical protein HIY_11830 [Haemophilus influenzae]